MATTKAPPPLPTPNGVISAPPKGVVGANRKKQKRRAKQAAKAAQQLPRAEDIEHVAKAVFDEDPLGYGEEEYDYSDAEADQYHDQYVPPHAGINGMDLPPPSTTRKKNKKKKEPGSQHQNGYDPSLFPAIPNPPASASAMARGGNKGSHNHSNIWNTSTAQERQNIKDFWLSLSEEERKSLLKIEKEAVLRKMKQQQKHSCSCTVCGRKRTAIEEELEVLYEGYYEELEQYAHHDHPPLPSPDGLMPDPLQHRRPHPLAAPPPNPQHKTSALHEHLDEEEEYSEDEEEEEYSDEEEDYSDEEPEPVPRGAGVPDFFNFGQNLTVKDNLLTVADDLLKNDGRKFIEMMEQLAERRVQRENEAEYAAANPSHPGAYPQEPGYSHEDPLAAGDEYDDDEASYDSQEYDEDDMDEESEMGGLTEEQRMQEGRRMFQIFAARMFEQRVLNAYREKVAAERQAKLLEELQDEDKLAAQRQAKKERDAAKKKEKKKQQQQAKAEEKARKDAEKAAEEARLREAEEKKQEEQRRRKEEQRKKKEEEKRKQDEEKARKEAEKARRLQEEQQRREEAERKAREQKAAEKARKDEARKREREEREAREKEAREKKIQEDRERKEREAKAKAEKEAKEREKAAQQAAQPPQVHQTPQIQKRPSQVGMVAIPGVHPKQTPSGISSPHPSIAMPAIPKSQTPAKHRQTSQHGSHASSPKQTQSQVSSAPSKSSSPNSVQAQQNHPPAATHPKTIMQKPSTQQMQQAHTMQPHPGSIHQGSIQPPPGMHGHLLQQHPGGFGAISPLGFPGFPPPQPPMIHHRGSMPIYQQQQPPAHGIPLGMPNRMGFSPGIHPMPPPPPGMLSPQARGTGFPFDVPPVSGVQPPPPGFAHAPMPQQQPLHTSPIRQPALHQPVGPDGPRPSIPVHSRQPSASEKERFEAAANQPIARPAPIQRPSSVKPGSSRERKGSNTDIDDLSKHLGSSALLADDDEPLPTAADSRRHSGMIQGQNPVRNGPQLGTLGGLGGLGSPPTTFGVPGGNWSTPSLPFGQTSGLGVTPNQNWGNLPTPSGLPWSQNGTAFTGNGAFGPLGAIGGPGVPLSHHRPAGVSLSRPLTIRLAVCQACKQLTNANAARPEGPGDGFHPVDVLLRQIEHNRPMLDSPPTLREIEEICETEGDSQNGGGELSIRNTDGGGFEVKFEPDARTPDHQGRGGGGLGEIGSPMPSKISPAFGAPGMGRSTASGGFQSLGAVGSAGF